MSLSADQLTLVRMYLADRGSSAIQSILIENAVDGTFTITYSGQTTAAIAFNASAADVQNALCALSNVGVGNMTVNNTFPYVVYFDGTLGRVAQTMLTLNTTNLVSPTGIRATVKQVAKGGQYAFSDTELDLLYSDAAQNLDLCVAFAFRALAADFSRLADYVAGQTQEKKSQIFDNVRQMYALWYEQARAGEQVQIVSLSQVPPRERAWPYLTGVPATSLSIRPSSRWGPWLRSGGR